MDKQGKKITNRWKEIISRVLRRKYWDNLSLPEGIFIVLLATLMMYGLLYKMGTLSSGYHFLDDHELIRLELSYQNGQSLGSVMKGSIVNDFHNRFRPLYWVERTIGAYFFGADLLPWNIYTAIKGIITFCLLYFAARYLRCNPIISGLFTCLIIYGAQFTPWYRSANQENTGLLLCALTMCLMAIQSYYKKYKSPLLNFLIVLTAVLGGLVKESFTLMMPAFIAAKFWLEYCENPGEKFWHCFKRNWLTYSIILVAFFVNIYMLLFRVGIDQVSYAGFHADTDIAEYWEGIVMSYQLFIRRYIDAAVIFFVILLIGAGKKNWKKYLGYFLIGGYVLAVQLVAHAKSAMWERYIIPWIVGYAFVFVILGFKMLKDSKICKALYFVVLCILLFMEAPVAYTKGREYAYDGWLAKLYFQSILDNTDEQSHIICAFRDAELNLATECWLETRERTQVYSYNVDTGELFNYVQLKGDAPTDMDWQNAKVVTCYANQVEEVRAMMDLSDSAQCSVSINGQYATICIGESVR